MQSVFRFWEHRACDSILVGYENHPLRRVPGSAGLAARTAPVPWADHARCGGEAGCPPLVGVQDRDRRAAAGCLRIPCPMPGDRLRLPEGDAYAHGREWMKGVRVTHPENRGTAIPNLRALCAFVCAKSAMPLVAGLIRRSGWLSLLERIRHDQHRTARPAHHLAGHVPEQPLRDRAAPLTSDHNQIRIV